MDRPFFTVRYSRCAVVLIAVLAISAALDTVAWYHTINRLEATAQTTMATARENGWTVEATPLRKSGWPFGAWVELDRLETAHATRTAAPYDAGWAGEHIRLGGSWIHLLRSGLPLSLTGHQAARLVLDGNILTVLASNLQIHLRNPGNLTFSVPQLELTLSGRGPDRQFSLLFLSGRLIRFPEAQAGATRLGINVNAAKVTGFPLPYGLAPNLQNAHLAIAMTASPTSTGLSLLDATSYGRLLLQDASASPATTSPDNRIILAGPLNLPDYDGTLTLTVTRWHELAAHLLERPEIQSRLSPDLQEMLRKLLQKTSIPSGMREQPLSLSVPVINGRMTPDAQITSALVSQHFQSP